MAHYDCNNCGHSYGVSFGNCENCTSEEYKRLQKVLNEKINSLEAKFKKMKIQALMNQLSLAHHSINCSPTEAVDKLVKHYTKKERHKLALEKERCTK